MKRILAFLLASVLVSASSAFSAYGEDSEKNQIISEQRIAVKLNGAALLGVINPAIEIKVHDQFSVQLEGMGIFYPYGIPGTELPLNLGATFLEAHWYPKGTFRGFYLGPNFGWGMWRLTKGLVPAYWGTYPDSYQVGTNIMAGLTLGYQFCIGKHWGIDIAWGLGYSNSAYEGHRTSDGSMYVGWNHSGEWLPAYKGAVNIVYRW